MTPTPPKLPHLAEALSEVPSRAHGETAPPAEAPPAPDLDELEALHAEYAEVCASGRTDEEAHLTKYEYESALVAAAPWLIATAREAELVRSSKENAVATMLTYRERLTALESALRPLVPDGEVTAERVGEAVARAVRNAEILASIVQVSGDCGDCPCCEMATAPDGFEHDEDCPIGELAADAARKETK